MKLFCILLLVTGCCATALDPVYWLQRVETLQPWWHTQRNPHPQHSIIFVKTHKTASSTVTSILHRYCDQQHSVRCYVPRGMGGGLVQPPSSPPHISGNYSSPVQVYAQHTYYWPTFLHTLVPPPAPVLSLIRNPASRFLSMWDYRHFSWRGRKDIHNILQELPQELSQLPVDFHPFVEHDSAHRELCPPVPLWALSNSSEPSCVQTLRDMLSGKLALVLVTERLDESLVLLARSMGWSLKSIAYSSMKISAHSGQHNKPSKEVTEKLESWLSTDQLLYEVALALLDRRIESQDASFWQELEELKRLKKQVILDCFGQKQGLEFSPATCKLLLRDNLSWVAAQKSATPMTRRKTA